MKSLIGLPNTHIAGDTFVSGSGVLRYCSMATRKASVSKPPVADVFEVIILFMVLTPISARQFECGKATDDKRWSTPQVRRNDFVIEAVNSDPPSVAISSGMPKVAKMRFRHFMSPLAPFFERSAMG